MLRIIYFLVKTKGYTLKGAQERLKAEQKQVEAQLQAVDTLKSMRSFLLQLKDEL
jgi:hypothetical protein